MYPEFHFCHKMYVLVSGAPVIATGGQFWYIVSRVPIIAIRGKYK